MPHILLSTGRAALRQETGYDLTQAGCLSTCLLVRPKHGSYVLSLSYKQLSCGLLVGVLAGAAGCPLPVSGSHMHMVRFLTIMPPCLLQLQL